MRRRELIKNFLALGAFALVPRLPVIVTPRVRQKTLDDLVLMRDKGIPINPALFESVRHHENTQRDFASCFYCAAKTWEQHAKWCDRATILWEENWYEVVKGWEQLVPRLAVIFHMDGRIGARKCVSQDAALAWLRTQYKNGAQIEILNAEDAVPYWRTAYA